MSRMTELKGGGNEEEEEEVEEKRRGRGSGSVSLSKSLWMMAGSKRMEKRRGAYADED